MRSALALMFAAVVVAAGACGPLPGGTPTFTDPSKSISVSKGQTFEVRIETNPTTGYRWFIATPPDPGVLGGGDSHYDGPDGPGVGAGGHEVFTYHAVGTGQTEIVMFYSRSESASSGPSVNRVTWRITVH